MTWRFDMLREIESNTLEQRHLHFKFNVQKSECRGMCEYESISFFNNSILQTAVSR